MNDKPPAIKKTHILETIWTDCPKEVYDEVSLLWRENEFGNDSYYYHWVRENEVEYYDEEYDISEELSENKTCWPIIDAYLLGQNVEDCLIHFWW